MSIKEMREKQAKLLSEARERLDLINSNTEESRVKELEASHDAAMAELDKIGVAIERQAKLDEMEARARAAQERAEEEQRHSRRPVAEAPVARAQDEGETPSYRKVFYEFLRRGGDIAEMSMEEKRLLRSGVDSSAEFRVQTTIGGSGSAGGYTVPVDLENFIIKSMKMWGPMYDEALCTVFSTSSGNSMKLPTVDDTAVTAEAHTEGTALTDDGGKDVTIGQKSLDAYVYDTEFVRFSFELAADSDFNIETLLGQLLGERLGRIANLRLTTGTGTGMPHGIVTASTAGKTATANNAITTDEVIDLLHSVDPAYRQSPKVRFMMNDLTLSALRKLKDSNGQYIWEMGDIKTGIPGTLLGYPYSINQAMASIGASARVMLFGDFGKYYVRKVGAPSVGVLRERFWPDLGIAGLIRLDGELGDTAAVKHLIMNS